MSERSKRLARRHPMRFADRAASRATGETRSALTGGATGAAATTLTLGVPGVTAAGQGGRWGLVLGGGGVLGASWLIGALAALEQARGIDARDAELIVGTSAGSVIGALLAAGVSVEDQRARESAPPVPGGERTAGALDELDVDDQIAGGSRPQRPRLRPGSPAIIRNNRGSLRQMPRTAVLAGLAPTGRGRLTGVKRLIEAVVPEGEWTTNPGYRAVTLDYETGRRVIFGAPGSPPAGLSEAVVASCSIPGWFEPVTIGGTRYVDGGAWSATNADLLVDAGLDELFVLAPMVSMRYDAPADVRARVERRVRISVTRRCLAEARLVQTAGTAVTVAGPGPRELELMGYNLMAPSRRGPVMASAYDTVLAALGSTSPAETQPDKAQPAEARPAQTSPGVVVDLVPADQPPVDH